jgi:hypothetical protein
MRAAGSTAREIAKATGRTTVQVQAKLKRLRLVGPYRAWTARDRDRLRKEYPEAGAEECARRLGRTVDAVRAAAGRFGVRDRERASDAMLDREVLLVDLIGKGSDPYAAGRAMGWTYFTIRNTLRRLVADGMVVRGERLKGHHQRWAYRLSRSYRGLGRRGQDFTRATKPPTN